MIRNEKEITTFNYEKAFHSIRDLIRGNSMYNCPYLYPSNGSTEISESFCRLSAVNGGEFILSCVYKHLDNKTLETQHGAFTLWENYRTNRV